MNAEKLREMFNGSYVEDEGPAGYARHFLRHLFGSHIEDTKQFLELRFISSNHILQKFYGGVDEVLRDWGYIENLQAREYNVHYGVCPRVRKSGKITDVSHAVALWADVDYYKGQEDRRACFERLTAFKPRPSVIVSSGGGFHCYWSIPITEVSEKLKNTLRGLQRAVGSDSVHDFSRVMRLPGTLNLKNENKKEVKVVWYSS